MSAHLSRRGFLGVAGAALGASTLAACGFAPTSSSSSASSDSLVFRWWGGDARNQAYIKALQVFTKKTGIKVTTEYSGYDGYFDKLNTEFAAGNPPDVFQMDTQLTSTYSAKGVLTNLGKYVPGTIQLADLFSGVRDAGAVKGSVYGVPSGSGYAPVLYNKSVLEQLKLAVPADSWTWDDFTALANEITKAWGSGKYGALDSSGDDTGALQPWLRQRGKDLYNADSSGLGFDAEDLTDWWTYWDGLRRTNAICPPDLLANADEASGTHPLIAGQIAMTTGWGLAQMAPLTKDTLDIVVVPRSTTTHDTGQALNGGVLLCIPTKSGNPDGAAKLIDFFMTDTDAITIMGIQRGFPPSQLATNILLPTLDTADKRDVTYGQYVAQQVDAEKLPASPTSPPGYADVKTSLSQYAQQVAFGKSTIPAAVTAFFNDAKNELAAAK